MTRLNSSTVLGGLLLLAGLFLLAQSLGFIAFASPALWGMLFLLVGLGFLALIVGKPNEWWPAIPGFVFLGLAVVVGLQAIDPGIQRSIGGSLFLALFGMGFAVVYLIHRENWWAIIPAGTLLTLAAVAALSSPGRIHGQESGGLFFFGLGLTFLAVYLVPTPRGRAAWAVYPAVVLMAMGALIGVGTALPMGLVWPLVLIIIGGYLLLRSSRRSRA